MMSGSISTRPARIAARRSCHGPPRFQMFKVTIRKPRIELTYYDVAADDTRHPAGGGMTACAAARNGSTSLLEAVDAKTRGDGGHAGHAAELLLGVRPRGGRHVAEADDRGA